MVTEVLDALAGRDESVQRAGAWLREGKLVAIPTETVYGLAACISNEAALKNIFDVKGRPADNPLIVHIAHRSDVNDLAYVDATSQHLMDALWPGALTFVLPRKERVNDVVTAGLNTVAVRMPSLALTREIIQASGEPLAAPSANISGRPSATTAQHVLNDFSGRIAAIVDGGPCEQGIESTVIRVEEGRVLVLRPGGVTRAQLAAVVGDALLDARSNAVNVSGSPGTHHRHYAPHASVVLCYSVDEMIREVQGQGEVSEEGADEVSEEGALGNILVLAATDPQLGAAFRPLTAATLFSEFRHADELHLDKILVHCTDAVKLDEALMNRLRKAAEPFGESGVDK